MPALQEVDALEEIVNTLQHKSPFCVAAAAGALAWVGRFRGGKAALEACGAIPALVPIITRQTPFLLQVGLPEEMPLFRKCDPDMPLTWWRLSVT